MPRKCASMVAADVLLEERCVLEPASTCSRTADIVAPAAWPVRSDFCVSMGDAVVAAQRCAVVDVSISPMIEATVVGAAFLVDQHKRALLVGVDVRALRRGCTGGLCVDTQSSPTNCGTCGNVCRDGRICSSGSCVCAGAMELFCVSGCANVQTDPSNCGSCGNVCAPGRTCVAGTCVCPTLNAPQAVCDGRCVDPWTNPEHCGGCGMACPAGQRCNGTCGAATVAQVRAGTNHTCARYTNGTVVCWGANYVSQLGDGTRTSRNFPTAVLGLTDVRSIATPTDSSCSLGTDDAVRCWGSLASMMPSLAIGFPNATGFAAGPQHVCAQIADGTLRCWGTNNSGQLGDGSYTSRTTPVSVTSVRTALEVVVGVSYSCARLADRTAVCWGLNGAGVLGNNSSFPSSNVPVPVIALTDIAQLSAGYTHVCARTGAGGVYCWGQNTNGSLGTGSSASSSVPVMVLGLSEAAEVSAGGSHTCARLMDGTVRCWGNNSYGQLGDGTMISRSTATAVVGLTDVVELAAGEAHTCARRADNSVWCWGRNFNGQLGDGTLMTRLSPVQVMGL